LRVDAALGGGDESESLSLVMPNDARPLFVTAALRAASRVRRAFVWAIGVVLAFGVIGFLLLHLLARPALERSLSAAIDRKVAIGQLEINPFAVSATLHDVKIADRGEGPALLTLAELRINGEISSLFRWAPVIGELNVTRPALHLVRNPDKTYNFSDLIEQALKGPPGPPPRFSIGNIRIVDGRIDFDDRPQHRQHRVSELNIGIPFLSSLPAQTEIKVEPAFSALVNGSRVALTGETRPFKDTHETVVHWDVSGLPLPLYLEYVPVKLPVKVESGRLDTKLDLTFIGHGEASPEITVAGTFRFADLVLNELSGGPLLRLPSLAVAINKLDPIGRSLEVRSIVAEGAELNVQRRSSGDLNLAILAGSDAAAKPEKPFRFHVRSMALSHGSMRVSDAAVTPTFAATLSDVTLEATELGNAGNQKANVALSFATDAGERVIHRGTLGLAPVSVDGRLDVTGLKLARLFPYYGSALNLVVEDGALDASTEVRTVDDRGATALALTGLGATVTNLKLRLPDEKELLWRVSTLAVRGGSVDVPKHTITFEAIEGRDALAVIRRGAEGGFNFDRLIRTPAGGVSAAATDEAWRVAARSVSLDDFAANFVDQSVTPPVRLALTRVSVVGENLSNAAKATGRATLKATVNKRGSLSLAGPIATAPLAGTLSVVAKNIDLVPFQAYIAQPSRIVVTGGAASAQGTIEVATGPAPRTAFKGEVVLGDVVALDEANAADLFKWKTLALKRVDGRLEPLAVSIDEIALDDFFARLILNENGEFNLQQLARRREAAAAPPVATDSPPPTDSRATVETATAPGAATTWLKLGKATLGHGNVYFTDHFIRPNYSANLSDLNGGLSTLAFDQPADIELHGKVQDSAPLEITGRINPLARNLFLDLKASASDIELSPLSPYSGKYVGYGIEKGKLSMKVHYLIDDRKLTAENSIVLNQLTFGDKVESPDAIKAPVLLAVALLKDRNGVINFDLPVGGSIDDPKFSVGGLIFRAIVNLIVKIVTAPFALLGSLGKHGEELAYIEFAPGSSALDAVGQDKIKSVAKALNERPALKLDVAGRVDPAVDREGLKRSALDRQVRLQKFNDLVRRGEAPASVDDVEVTAAEYEPLLSRVYRAADFPKPRNAIGFPKDLPRDEMESLLLSHSNVDDEALRLLGERRAQIVHASLVESEQVPRERVFLVAPRLNAEGLKDKGKATRVDFALH
jgi:hypothetical protein